MRFFRKIKLKIAIKLCKLVKSELYEYNALLYFKYLEFIFDMLIKIITYTKDKKVIIKIKNIIKFVYKAIKWFIYNRFHINKIKKYINIIFFRKN